MAVSQDGRAGEAVTVTMTMTELAALRKMVVGWLREGIAGTYLYPDELGALRAIGVDSDGTVETGSRWTPTPQNVGQIKQESGP